ncbi:PREDICTED: uncharacterized protein LOC108557119 [Nicrophorus vespilloides]|uniref:Uncharacterized protein LOC108557119 n=1 Tax=Nicrophorus vespilloides TaxID=110193 RepID=A0ABM1M363_NICVS|nr:PREDICTED: uncharacterized protein LOC108557119 [Nicrophorus vespilloides]
MCSALINVSVPVLIFVFGLLNVGNSVKINRLQVPEVIRHGAPVVLDCDFTLEATDSDLVVKWFFNKNKTLVYQWIPGSSTRPQVSGILKGRLNLEYAASVDGNSVHRALHILKPGPDLSGDYTCSVSTFQSEDIRTKSMLVFVPEKSLILRRVSADAEDIRVECKAEGVFPKPDIVLRSQQRRGPRGRESIRGVRTMVTFNRKQGDRGWWFEQSRSYANITNGTSRFAVFDKALAAYVAALPQ